jgi:hypothetical protein
MTRSVTVVTPRAAELPANGLWVIKSGAEPLQSLATTLLVKSGTTAAQAPLAKAL